MFFFRSKTIIIRDEKKTEYIQLTTFRQIILFACFCAFIMVCCWQYVRYKNASTNEILLEYKQIMEENKNYKNYFSSLSEKLDKINKYLQVRERIDGLRVPYEGANEAITKAIIDKQINDTYKGLEERNKYLNKKIERLHINSMDYKHQSIENDTKDTNAQGGPYETFPTFITRKTKPLLTLNKVKINNDNYKEIISQLINAENIVSSLPLGKPMEGGYRITSKYGKRIDPIDNTKIGFHKGIDIVINNGNVITPKDGIVSFVGKKQGHGNCVEIEHSYFPKSYSIKTRYSHLETIDVRENEKVRGGDRIGQQGKTGRATGYHLHYGILINNIDVDPINFIHYK